MAGAGCGHRRSRAGRPSGRLARGAPHRHLLHDDHPGIRPDGLFHGEFAAVGLHRRRERHPRRAGAGARLRRTRHSHKRGIADVRTVRGHLFCRLCTCPAYRPLAGRRSTARHQGEHRPGRDARPQRAGLQADRLRHRRTLRRPCGRLARLVPELHAARRICAGNLRTACGADHCRRCRHPGRAAGGRGGLDVAARQSAARSRPCHAVEAGARACLHRAGDRPAPRHLRRDRPLVERTAKLRRVARRRGRNTGHRGDRRKHREAARAPRA